MHKVLCWTAITVSIEDEISYQLFQKAVEALKAILQYHIDHNDHQIGKIM